MMTTTDIPSNQEVYAAKIKGTEKPQMALA